MNATPHGLVVAIASEKGGVGKSTIAATLASHWHSLGWRICVADLDPQATLLDWAAVAEVNDLEAPPVLAIGDNVRSAINGTASNYDVTIIDCPGRMGRRLAGALMVADLVLLPVATGAPDAWALQRVLDRVGEARELRPELQATLVINRSLRTRVASATVDALRGIEGVEHCPVSIGNRAAIAEAVAAGTGVTVHNSGSVAAFEASQLADWIADRIGLEPAEASDVA